MSSVPSRRRDILLPSASNCRVKSGCKAKDDIVSARQVEMCEKTTSKDDCENEDDCNWIFQRSMGCID